MFNLKAVVTAAALVVTACAQLPDKQSVEPAYQYQVSGDWKPIPDLKVNTGSLKNGLTWYTKELEDNGSRDRIELRLRINAGSLQENDQQQGLAHFVEHMAFNGTERFPEQQLIDFFEAAGMSFGGDINAHTSFDETVYKLTIPVDKPELVQTAMEVLYDWATSIRFDEEEVAKEIPVIVEEWRSRQGTERSIGMQQFDIHYAGTRFGERLAIGDMDIVKAATAEDLKDYYQQWYRPDNTEIFVVYPEGAIDAIPMIEETFASWQQPETEIVEFDGGTMSWNGYEFHAVTDSDRTSHGWQIYIPIQSYDEYTPLGLELDSVEEIYLLAFQSRLKTMSEQEGSVLFGAGFKKSNFLDEQSALLLSASIKEGQEEQALQQLTEAFHQFVEYGITETEFATAKAKMLTNLEGYRGWLPSSSSAQQVGMMMNLVKEFGQVDDLPAMFDQTEDILNLIERSEVNQYIKSTVDHTKVRAFYRHPKTYQPNSTGWEALYLASWQKDVKAPVSETTVVEGDFYEFSGDVVAKQDRLAEHNLYQWTLANGIEVVLRPSDFQPGRVRASLTFEGGGSQMPVELILAQEQWASLRLENGLEGLSGQAFIDSLNVDGIYYEVDMGERYFSVDTIGQSDKFERMVRLMAGSFTEEKVNESLMVRELTRKAQSQKEYFATPDYNFWRQYLAAVYGDDPHAKYFTAEQIAALTKEQFLKVQELALATQQASVLVIVGDITPEQVEPLLTKYLAGLPVAEPQPQLRFGPITEKSQTLRIAGQTDERTSIRYVYAKADVDSDEMTYVAAEVMEDALEKRLHKAIREESGLTYGTSVFQSEQFEDDRQWLLHVRFSTDPEREQEALDALDAAMADVLVNPFTKAEVNEAMARRIEADKKSLTNNSGIEGSLVSAFMFGVDFALYDNYADYLNQVTPELVNDLIAELLSGKKVVSVYYP